MAGRHNPPDHRGPEATAGLRQRRRERGLPTGSLMDDLRQIEARRIARLRELADDDCVLCHGSGQTHGYVGPGKTATYNCPCTGEPEVT